ncbi:MAG: SirB2 family protein [Agarilytica sp.]
MLFVKHLHLTFVALSMLGFILRGIWMIMDSPLLQAKLTKILPHIIDTILLVSALTLAIKLGLSPGDHPWLLAKIVGLLFYIGLGVVALKPKFSKSVRIGAWIAAILCFWFIASAAIFKSAAGFFVTFM